MGQRGPIGLQSAVKRARQRGTRPLAPGVDPVPIGEPAAPANLDAEALQEWQRITDLLRARNVLDGLDQSALHDYVACWRRLRQCEEEIETRGLMISGANSAMVKNPVVSIARNYRAALLAWCKEFGLTFSSRNRLPMGTGKAAASNRFTEIKAANEKANARQRERVN